MYTPEFWKHTPTTAEAIFAIELPYRPPKNPVGAFIWRRRIWLETTIGLSVLEPWEKLMTIVFLYSLLLLVVTSVWKFLPMQVSLLEERMAYYFFGQEDKGIPTMTQMVSHLARHNMTREL